MERGVTQGAWSNSRGSVNLATSMGYALSTVLPVRAGDVIRPALLSRRTDVRFSRALGTVLTERVLDLTAILILYLSFIAISGGFLRFSEAGVWRTSILMGISLPVATLLFWPFRKQWNGSGSISSGVTG